MTKRFFFDISSNDCNLLNDEIDVIFKTFNKSVVIHVNAFFFNHKNEMIIEKNHFVLFKSIAKINANVFDFEKIFVNISKSTKIRDKNKNDVNIIDLEKIHKNMNFFFNDQTKLDIKNFQNIDEVAIVINMHFLFKNLFSNIEFITIFIVFDHIKKLF